MNRAVITGTGSYIPEIKVSNEFFSNHIFYEKENVKLIKSNDSIIEKFSDITGIFERRYAREDQQASDLGFLAAEEAIIDAGIDRETLDYIIVAHNFGDVAYDSNRTSMVPSLASRIKALLQIKNPDCVAYDLPFGCPGWVEGVIQANSFIRTGDAKRCLVIGTETLSRVLDPHDRDSMIFSDGSAAVIVEAQDSDKGILSHKTRTYALDNISLLNLSHSYSSDLEDKKSLFLKMNGRRVYEFALNYVPMLVKHVLEQAETDITEVKKVLIHQANAKMDEAILKRLFKLYDRDVAPAEVMPMTIQWLGNSSIATVPTLLDLILKKKLEGHTIAPGDKIVMTSVGAGMNINAILYQF